MHTVIKQSSDRLRKPVDETFATPAGTTPDEWRGPHCVDRGVSAPSHIAHGTYIAVHEVEARSTKEQPARAAGPIGIANWQPRGHFCTQIASPAPFYFSTGCQSRNCVKVFTWLKRTRRERSAPFFSPQNSQGRLRKSSSEICAKLIVRRADCACTRVNYIAGT